jgi:anti-anti-sigma factor
MSVDPRRTSAVPGPTGNAGAAVLLTAMESAAAAIYYLADHLRPVWANARARELGTGPDELPVIDGRPVAEVVAEALRTGVPHTLRGRLAGQGQSVTAQVRPMQTPDGAGALLMVEADNGGAARQRVEEGVEQAQLSLLPPSLPLLPDVRLSGSYHRATSVAAAGGDWYDAVPLGSGVLALVVGDAVGHGVPAAGAMSRLRGAMRSNALQDPSPQSVLRALDALAAQMDDVEGASVFYGLLDAASGRLTYTAAGHPAPLIAHADGTTSSLPVTPRPPLGSLPGAPAPVAERILGRGETLVLFSNGAVVGTDDPALATDRLAGIVQEVLQRPGALAADAVAGPAAAIAAGVRRPQGWPDDIAVLVAHRGTTRLEPFQLDMVAAPVALPAVRRRLGRWLADLGVGEQDGVGVMVAVGEACANAAEHAYRGVEPGPMGVRADVDVDGVLTVTVWDKGTWRPPERDPGDRGRGLLIMRQLVDGVTFDERDGTTVTLTVRLRQTQEPDPPQPQTSAGAAVAVDRTGERPVVRVRGGVDAVGAEQLRIRLLEASHGGAVAMDLDLTAVSLFSSAAVREVLGLARIARDEQWRLVVHAPEGSTVRHILEISGLAGLVDLR